MAWVRHSDGFLHGRASREPHDRMDFLAADVPADYIGQNPFDRMISRIDRPEHAPAQPDTHPIAWIFMPTSHANRA
jgi:hypothetical protein